MNRRAHIRKCIPALILALIAPAASADIWECTDALGNRRFTNIESEAKGCRLLNMPPLTTVPAVKPRQAPKANAPAPTPGNFPRVDADVQRERDADRRRILEQELANEEMLLQKARQDLEAQESVRLGSERNYQRVLDRLEPYKKKVKLHEDNVANLRRELATTR
jgi:hypothetical protein